MEHALRCNSLKCRTQLDDQAVVTTCSHIFCVPCSEALGLSNAHGSTRACPACNTQLPNADDAVVARLNPSEDYKTSVLSGLSPTIILECAGRALSFHSYQTTQEIVYQEYLARSLTDKYSTLSNQMDKIIENANAQITDMSGKIEALHLEQKKLEDKNHSLAEAFREKSKKQQQLQKMYTQLKQQQLATGLEVAADHDADNVLHHAAAAAYNDAGYRGGQAGHGRSGSGGSGGSGGRRNRNPAWYHPAVNNRAGMQSSHSVPVTMTPGGHRQRVPATIYSHEAMFNPAPNNPARHGTPQRAALHTIDANIAGYSNSHTPRLGGMSAGIKAGRPTLQTLPFVGGAGNSRPSGLYR